MLISENLSIFNGKPVVDFEPEKGIQTTEEVYRLRLDFDTYEKGKRLEEVLEQFCNDPKISEVKELVFGTWGYDDNSKELVKAIVKLKDKLSNLTHLMIGDITYEENEMSWIQQSNLTPAIEALPNLMYFCARGGTRIAFENLSHPTLQTLIVQTGGLQSYAVKQILAAKLPELQHLELWTGHENYGFDGKIEDYTPLLTQKIFPKLTYMGLRNSYLADEFAIALKDSYLLDQLETLDFSLGALGNMGGQAIVDNPKIKNLKKLELQAHFMKEELVAQIKSLDLETTIGDALGEPMDYGRYAEVGE